MKLIIQELIDEIVEHLTYDDKLSEDSRITYETIRLRCLSKLKKEEEQMKEMYLKGIENCDSLPQQETFVSKGSDEHHEDNLVEIPTSSQTEISDEEIEKEIKSRYETPHYNSGFMDCAKWYREQLKQL